MVLVAGHSPIEIRVGRHFKAAIIALFCVWSPLVWPGGTGLTASTIAWQSLRFEARHAFATGEANLSIDSVDSERASSALWSARAHRDLKPAGGLVKLNADVRLPGTAAQLRLWMDPVDFRLYQKWRYSSGGQSRLKTARFLTDGVLRTRRDPDRSAGDDPDTWPVKYNRITPFPAGANDETWLDPLALLLLVSAVGPYELGEQLSVPVFVDTQAYNVSLLVRGWEHLEFKYKADTGSGWKTVQEDRKVLKVAVIAKPLQAIQGDQEFSLLGLTEDIDIYFDPVSGLPVQLQGRVSDYGRQTIKLKSAVMADAHGWDNLIAAN